MKLPWSNSQQRPLRKLRRLRLETLEIRLALDTGLAAATVSTPWQNPTIRLDVNNDGVVSPSDALVVINELLDSGPGPLATPAVPAALFYDTSGDNYLSSIDPLLVINALNSAPQISLSTLTAATPDVTPQVTVAVAGGGSLPNGTPVSIDVDMNNNGNFQNDYTLGTLFNGSATFDLAPALPANRQGAPYQVTIRAHATDLDNVITYSASQPLTIDTDISTALSDYVNTPDPTYSYQLMQTTPDPSGLNLFTIYDVSMTSQTWRTTADVNQPVWQHWERIIVPSDVVQKTALFLIDGGSYSSTLPSIDGTVLAYAQTAVALHTVFIDLKDVPNEPLSFTGDNPPISRSEDDIIAYTYNQFLNNIGQPGNDTWPALLPMVKSAVRGMDTVQSFVPTVAAGDQITNFMVTGYSKRGWTTWLTAAVDPRVTAIIPGVFDNLNQGAQMVHHYSVYGFFSQAVQPYNNENIFQRILTPQGNALGEIVDPYHYLSEPKFATMPKLLINSAGDEFFVSDSAQYYFHDIPGTQNYLDYIPNVGHGLDPIDPSNDTLAFYYAVENNKPLPQFTWAVRPNGSIDVQTTTSPSQVLLWQATNPVARDFRNSTLLNPNSPTWTSSTLSDHGGGEYIGSTPMPSSGATAFFVQLTFPSPGPNMPPLVFTTEIHVNTQLPLFAWPFVNVAPSTSAAQGASLADAAPTSTIDSGGSTALMVSLNRQTTGVAGVILPVASGAGPLLPSRSDPTPALIGSAAGPAPIEENDSRSDAEQADATPDDTDTNAVDGVFGSPLVDFPI
jgi:PhoPQ-activated pathogenicity-related protein